MMGGMPNASGYLGQMVVIPLSKSSLFTDYANSDIPINGLIRANNVTYYNMVLQKDFGSRIWNSTPLPASIVKLREMYVDSLSQQQRIYALCADGNVYKFSNYASYLQVTPMSATNPTTPTTLVTQGYNSLVVGGLELAGNNKKLFVFNGHDTPQVISGDSNQRYSMSKPAVDWTGTNQPFGGVVHRGQLYCFGNQNNPNTVYASNVTNHEDFQTVNAYQVYNVYPGEYDGIVCLKVWRGRLWAFKYPLGIYYLVDNDPSQSNWYFTKQGDDFGACSPDSAEIVSQDMIIANNYGSLSSMQAALIYGDTTQKDIFYQLYTQRFAEQEIRPDAHQARMLMYYQARRQFYGCYQSFLSDSNDRLVVVDMKDQNQPGKISWINKDKPNCLLMKRDSLGVLRPFYGGPDGNIYEIGVEDRWVGSETDTTNQSAYLFDAQTPFMDLSNGDPTTASQVKTLDFLEIVYEPTGDWDVNIDVLIDGRFSKTYTCNLGARSDLSEMPLDSSPIDGLQPFFRRFQIYGEGRNVSLRFYNNGLGQDVRLIRAVIYFRLSGQQQMVV